MWRQMPGPLWAFRTNFRIPLDHFERELLTSRISCAQTRLRIRERAYILVGPIASDRYEAAEVYAQAFKEAEEELYGDAEIRSVLRNQGLWSDQDDVDLKTAESNLDKLKIEKYRATTTSKRHLAGQAIDATRKALASLLNRLHSLDHMTRSGHAAMARTRFLIGRCLRHADGFTPVWPGLEFWEDSSSLLDEVMQEVAERRPTEAQVRELARTEPWRGRWSCRKSESSLFGRPIADWTDDQIALVTWSRVYESCVEAENPPSDEVIGDDDMFDGWLLIRRQETEKSKSEKNNMVTKDRINPKIASADEVFICGAEEGAEEGMLTLEDVQAVEAMNTPEAAAIKKSRMALIAKKGHVLEAQMPDSQIKILNQLRAKGIR